MYRGYCALCLCLCVPLQMTAQDTDNLTTEEQVGRPYASLFDISGSWSPHEVRSLRSSLEKEREQQIETCHKTEQRLREQIASARTGLKELNEAAPRDTRSTAAARNDLHNNIAALEKAVRDKKAECEHEIPVAFEIQLAKVRLLEDWPERRRQTVHNIEEGRSRGRTHGDVDDIGYRKLVDDQDKDIAVGQQALREMTSSSLTPVEIQDPAVRQYVQDLAGRIARNSDLKVPLHVTVLDSAEINAVGIPGGFLLITSGLLIASETEAQLAGVISQQIAHIAARHATRTSKRSILTRMLVPAAQVATGLFTGGVSNAGVYYSMNYGFQGLGALVDRSLVSKSGKAQKEADQLGIQYAWKAGFDPKGLITFLDSLAKEKEYSKTASFFLTKPALGERLVDAFTEIQYLPSRENYVVDSAEFRNAREHLSNSQFPIPNFHPSGSVGSAPLPPMRIEN